MIDFDTFLRIATKLAVAGAVIHITNLHGIWHKNDETSEIFVKTKSLIPETTEIIEKVTWDSIGDKWNKSKLIY